MVKEAVPVLSTHRCLKKLVGLLDRMAAGSMRFTAWSTPQHRPAVHGQILKLVLRLYSLLRQSVQPSTVIVYTQLVATTAFGSTGKLSLEGRGVSD